MIRHMGAVFSEPSVTDIHDAANWPRVLTHADVRRLMTRYVTTTSLLKHRVKFCTGTKCIEYVRVSKHYERVDAPW